MACAGTGRAKGCASALDALLFNALLLKAQWLKIPNVMLCHLEERRWLASPMALMQEEHEVYQH